LLACCLAYPHRGNSARSVLAGQAAAAEAAARFALLCQCPPPTAARCSMLPSSQTPDPRRSPLRSRASVGLRRRLSGPSASTAQRSTRWRSSGQHGAPRPQPTTWDSPYHWQWRTSDTASDSAWQRGHGAISAKVFVRACPSSTPAPWIHGCCRPARSTSADATNARKGSTATTPTSSREVTTEQEGETETSGGFQPLLPNTMTRPRRRRGGEDAAATTVAAAVDKQRLMHISPPPPPTATAIVRPRSGLCCGLSTGPFLFAFVHASCQLDLPKLD
jgi:hypothetical protein